MPNSTIAKMSSYSIGEQSKEFNELRNNRVQMPQIPGLRYNAQDKIKASSPANVKRIFEYDENLRKLFRYNAFTGEIELYKHLDVFKLRKTDIEYADIQAQSYIEDKYDVFFDNRYYTNGKKSFLKDRDIEHEFNPIKEHIQKAKWDGTKRVETFFIDYLGVADTPLNRQSTQAWFIGLVGRVYHPGLKFELVPILTGAQSRGKSTCAKILCPKDSETGDYLYCQDGIRPAIQNTDDYPILHKNWILEFSELAGFNKAGVGTVKDFLSRQSDPYRKKYGIETIDHPRKFGFIGTTNSDEFLKDRTGNRRFIPMKIDAIKRKKDVWNPDDDDIHQILAEAYQYAVVEHRKPYLDDDMLAELSEVQSDYMRTDVDEDRIKEYANMLVPRDWTTYSLDAKKRYYSTFIDYGRYERQGTETTKVGHNLSPKELIKMNKFPTAELVEIVFGNRKSNGSLSKKVASVMNMLPEFSKTKVTYNNSRVNGYTRIK